MLKKIFAFLFCFVPMISIADTNDAISKAEEIIEATRITCSGISDEIAKVANISKANTAVSAVGTVAAGGALVTGIKKSQEEEEIDRLVKEICDKGGCDPETVQSMSLEKFYEDILIPMATIEELRARLERSKELGDWRTGLMAGTIGTNLASSIMSGLNINQSDLIQHITACNEMVKMASNAELDLRSMGVSTMDTPLMKDLGHIKTWCNQIEIKDVEKIEKRMKGVMGTSIAGTAIGVVGVGTSATANSDKYMSEKNKLTLSDSEKKKEKALNTTANVMAGANIATGAVETGLNISLITLTKKLMEQAERCEEVLK